MCTKCSCQSQQNNSHNRLVRLCIFLQKKPSRSVPNLLEIAFLRRAVKFITLPRTTPPGQSRHTFWTCPVGGWVKRMSTFLWDQNNVKCYGGSMLWWMTWFDNMFWIGFFVWLFIWWYIWLVYGSRKYDVLLCIFLHLFIFEHSYIWTFLHLHI